MQLQNLKSNECFCVPLHTYLYCEIGTTQDRIYRGVGGVQK